MFWHSFYLASFLAFYLTHILTFYLASFLTFYLTYVLTFYLAFYLASMLTLYLSYVLTFHLAFFWHSIWDSFGIVSGILFGMCSGPGVAHSIRSWRSWLGGEGGRGRRRSTSRGRRGRRKRTRSCTFLNLETLTWQEEEKMLDSCRFASELYTQKVAQCRWKLCPCTRTNGNQPENGSSLLSVVALLRMFFCSLGLLRTTTKVE